MTDLIGQWIVGIIMFIIGALCIVWFYSEFVDHFTT